MSYRVVPLVPTDEMIEAGAKAAADQHYYKEDVWNRSWFDEGLKADFRNGVKFAWKAMLKTAISSCDNETI